MIETTQEAEIKRVRQRVRPLPEWGLLTTTSIVSAVHFARDNGWKDKKVQVRVEKTADDMVQYYVEPFEKDCSCPNILRYGDFFD